MNIDKVLIQLEKVASLSNALCALMIQDGITATAAYVLAEMIKEAANYKEEKQL